MEDTSPTGETALATTSADASTAVDAGTPASATEVGQVAQGALDQSTPATTPDPLEQVLTAIPADDTDLTAYQGGQHYQAMVQQREQLRTLERAVRELQPLRSFQQYGEPAAVERNIQLGKLLYSPLLRDGKPVIDPKTRTSYVTTLPLWQHLDKVSPGMPEQAFVDLVNFKPTGENGQVEESLGNQYLLYLKLDPARLAEYRSIDSLVARTSGAVTADELAEIPAEFHAAYRTIPPSIRAAWNSYDAADQTRMLQDYKDRLDNVAEREQRRAEDAQRKAAADAQYQATVITEQNKYLDTVRRERTASIIQSLGQQVTFSTDPTTNKVMIGTLAASLAQLLDPTWRFVVEENVLAPLGLKLDHTFDEALARFESAAADSVAQRMAGDIGRAEQARADASSAANQLMARLAIFALKVAAKQGATVVEKATVQAGALAAAATGRPAAGNGFGTASPNGSTLPPGMIPGSREATEYLARQTGFFQ